MLSQEPYFRHVAGLFKSTSSLTGLPVTARTPFVGNATKKRLPSTCRGQTEFTGRTIYLPEPSRWARDWGSEWYSLLYNYRRRSLSKQTDTLPALGASLVSSRAHRREYFAGIWPAHGVHGLLWHATYVWSLDNFDVTYFSEMKDCRKGDYVAPSWSWASIKGQIQYVYGFNQKQTANHDQDTTATILDIKTTLRGADPFGATVAGSIRIRGKVKKGRITSVRNVC